MLIRKSIFLVFLLQSLFSYSQYVVKSEFINNPENNIEYVRKNAEFWITSAFDSNYGGFFSSIGVEGNVLDYNKKSLISQSRHGFGFTKAFMLTGDEKYLTYAASALKFLTDFGWDNVNEGWYTFAKANGTLDNRAGWNPNSKKYGFQQHYALLGITANYEATRNPVIKQWLDKGLASLEKNMWDARTGYEGYYEDASINWSTKTGKGFTPTVDAITTHTELSYLTSNLPEDKERLITLANIIVNRFIPEMDNSKVLILFPGSYSSDWVPNYSSGNSVGHFVKTAWCLGRAYLCDTTNTHFKDAAIKILDKAWNYQNGTISTWDKINGGPYNQVVPTTGLWGTNGDSKDYWTVEQGFTGPMLNYHITKNPIYLQMADESMNFFMTNLVDKVNGEIFSQTDPTGKAVLNSTKGDDFKASYHSIEMGYYGYLYSKLYYLHQPASLYYKFEASETPYSVTLTPISYQNNLLKIKEVSLNNELFTTFDKDTRTLNIPAQVGGKFKVTFETQAQPTNVENATTTISPMLYPNIAKDHIRITGVGNIDNIVIFDVSLKIVYNQRTNNTEMIDIAVEEFKSGVYFVKLKSVDGENSMLKFIKL